MKRILCLFDHYARTGYGTVSEQLIAHLIEHFGTDFGFHIIATNYFGDPMEVVMKGQVVVYVEKAVITDKEIAEEHKEMNNFGIMKFVERLTTMDFDGIFIMQDLGIVKPLIPILKGLKEGKRAANRKQFKSVFYFPVDGDLASSYFDGLEFFDLSVTYTEYGRKQALNANPHLKSGKNLTVIPHGISTEDFHLVTAEEVSKFREEYFGDATHEKFIVGVINRNQPRKDIPTAILGFVEAKKNWDNRNYKPFLYLHMHPKDPKGWDLRQILGLCGLVEGEDYMFPKSEDPNYQVDTKTLNLIYNSIDVYLSTSKGEGWGLTAVEAMATATLCILPDNTSYTEIGTGRAIMLNCTMPVVTIDDNLIRYLCEDLEVGAELIYSSKLTAEAHKKITDSAMDFVKNNTWHEVCKKWRDLFKKAY